MLSSIQGIIERRILVNYRIDPTAIEALLPAPFKPKLVEGQAIVGICLIRLNKMRPHFGLNVCGLRSENAAHRIAVEWEENGKHHEGVYIPRRDTSSLLNHWLGGRLFPGKQNLASFNVKEEVTENQGSYHIEINSQDRQISVALDAFIDPVKGLENSLFNNLEEVSKFFYDGRTGYSPSATHKTLEGMTLESASWDMIPLTVTRLHSSFWESYDGLVFDSAVLMRDIRHHWEKEPAICTSSCA